MKKKLFNLVLLIAAALAATSCVSNQDYIYLQGAETAYAVPVEVAQAFDLRIQPNDELAIAVSSKNSELIEPFNHTVLIGGGSSSTYGSNTNNVTSRIAYFLVDKDGNIFFPILGQLSASGKTMKELANEIQAMLIDGNYILDAVVTVKLMSSKITILGDVKSPGVHTFSNERLTILEALGQAGDINSTAKRKPILVVREEDGKRVTYEVDLTDSKSVFESPAYYIRQNDVIYVQPNRAARMKVSPGYTVLTLLSTAASLLISIVTFIIALT